MGTMMVMMLICCYGMPIAFDRLAVQYSEEREKRNGGKGVSKVLCITKWGSYSRQFEVGVREVNRHNRASGSTDKRMRQYSRNEVGDK